LADYDRNYLFTNLAGGDYDSTFNDMPADYRFTARDQSGDDATDSDADSTGQTACISLAPTESNRTPDAGITPNRLKVCEASEFAPSGYAMIFTSGDYPGAINLWDFDQNGGEFITYANGTARLTGQVVNQGDNNLRFCAELRLIDRRDWGEWTALGRLVKDPDNGPEMSWEFLEVDSLHSYLEGKGSLAGTTLSLSHEPVNRDYGFQLGLGANTFSQVEGLGGWFRFVDQATGDSGTGDFNVNLDNCVDHQITPVAPQLGALALLQGTYDASRQKMRADLRAQGLLPSTQPFAASPWNYTGNEQMAATAPDSVVDWVLVELRDVNDQTTILHRQAGLLLQGGHVVSSDGHSLMEMPAGITSAYLVVYNWNHLPVMSAQPLQQYGKLFYHDFTQGSGSIYRDFSIPNAAAELIPGGITLLYEGDATSDGQDNSLDLGQVMQQYFQAGSASQDINLDGVVNSLDVGRSMRNYFKRTHVPK